MVAPTALKETARQTEFLHYLKRLEIFDENERLMQPKMFNTFALFLTETLALIGVK